MRRSIKSAHRELTRPLFCVNAGNLLVAAVGIMAGYYIKRQIGEDSQAQVNGLGVIYSGGTIITPRQNPLLRHRWDTMYGSGRVPLWR